MEKYRPKNIKDFIGNKRNRERIDSMIKARRLPNLYLTGLAGTGKTSYAEYIAREFLGDNFENDCRMFNASSETGVQNIRDNIIDTMDIMTLSGMLIIILDEIEPLSLNSQQALRRAMEEGAKNNVRFILISNEEEKTIPPIISRCLVLKFLPITPSDMIPRLKMISEKEEINISDDLIRKLAEYSNGDIRNPINRLEELKALNREVKSDDIQLSSNIENIKEILDLIMKGNLKHARNRTFSLYEDGMNTMDIIRSFHDFFAKYSDTGDDYTKSKILIAIGEADRNIKLRCDQFLQLTMLISKIHVLATDFKRGV